MRYQHSFRVQAPLELVHQFHQSTDSFKALTPPPIIVQLHRAPEIPREGDQMEFTLWMGPLPVRWVAEFSDIDEKGFTDRQIRGPFKYWVHRHRFLPGEAGQTEIQDQVEAEVGWGWQAPIAAAMWIGLPLLFAYRAWRTRQALHRRMRGEREANE